MDSVWTEGAKRPHFDKLSGKADTDVLIIGGGVAGLLCAYKLKNAGIDCILLEADKICSGITKNTTAKITLSHGLIYHKIIVRFGEEYAKYYLKAQENALKEYVSLCKSIDCDFKTADNFVYSLTDKDKINKETEALQRLGADAEFSMAEELPFAVAGAVRVKEQGQFHPLKFLFEIARTLPIYENTFVKELTPKKAITKDGEITYKRIVVATHFPFLNKHGAYFLKLYQHRSYVIALEGAAVTKGMYVDDSDKGLSFRPHKDLLLLGGGGHRTGKTGGGWKELEDFAKKYYKEANIVAKWATQDCISLDGIPYIGQYSKSTPNVYVSTGFNKWGMTNAMAAANILCDMIQGKSSPFAPVFSPQRSILRPQLCVNAFETALSLITPTAPRCPHMGCELSWNPDERSWDCPCHGSRFTADGNLIDNPAKRDKK